MSHFEWVCTQCGVRVGGCRCPEGHHNKIPKGFCDKCTKILKAHGSVTSMDDPEFKKRMGIPVSMWRCHCGLLHDIEKRNCKGCGGYGPAKEV